MGDPTYVPEETFLRALSMHEAARKLGISADDIFIHPRLTDGGYFAVVIGTVAFPLGLCEAPPDQVQEAWGRAVAWWNNREDPDTQKQVYESFVATHGATNLAMNLLAAQSTLGTVAQMKEEHDAH